MKAVVVVAFATLLLAAGVSFGLAFLRAVERTAMQHVESGQP